MGELQPNFCDKQETITIKKELWDEMLDHKKKVAGLISNIQAIWAEFQRVDVLEKQVKPLDAQLASHWAAIVYDGEEIEKLIKHKNYQELFNTQLNRIDDYEERIEKIEELAQYNMSPQVQELFNSIHTKYAERIEKLETQLSTKSLNTLTILNDQNKCLEKFNERIQNLEQHENYKIDSILFSTLRIKEIEEKIKSMDKVLDSLCN